MSARKMMMGAAGGGSGPDATVNFVNSYVDGGVGNPYTFTIDVGDLTTTGLTNRYIAVGIDLGNSTTTPTSVTIMGAASSLVKKGDNGSDKASYIYVTDAPVTTNGTLTVVVDITTDRGACGVWELFDIDNTATAM